MTAEKTNVCYSCTKRHATIHNITVKPVFFAYPLFREFRLPGKFAKITDRENLNTVAFQCSRKQKRQNYGVQNN